MQKIKEVKRTLPVLLIIALNFIEIILKAY
jgi:hypothetical protein